jgi:hypothetical protein
VPKWLPVGNDVELDPNKAVEDAARIMREKPGLPIESRTPPEIPRE